MNHRDLIERSLEELRLKTAAHDRIWHLAEADWRVDQGSGQIVFTAPNGMVATCSVQIIGTFDSNNSTWLWGWDHPSVELSLRKHAQRLREYGEANGIPELTTRILSATEDQCWEFTALACKLNEAQGGYRGPAGPTLVFMTYGEPALRSENGTENGRGKAIEVESANFTAAIPDDVRSTVAGFIKALYEWEVEAHAAVQKNRLQGMKFARESHAHLIQEWCASELDPQPMSFGNIPKHDVNTEQILEAAVSENKCHVRTKHTDEMGFVSDYEYHLRFEKGKWLFEQLFYVDDEGKYEML